jgi:hypothetical protein
MPLNQSAPLLDEYDPLAVYGPPDPDDAREVIFREVVDTANPYTLMSPIPPPRADPVVWMERYVEFKKQIIDATIVTRESDARARENYRRLYKMGAFSGPNGLSVNYDAEREAYWAKRLEEDYRDNP